MKVLYPVCIIFVLKIDIPMDILFLVGGLLLILLGANGLTDGAASVAKRFHIPSIVIGLTIVAFGTSAPEPGRRRPRPRMGAVRRIPRRAGRARPRPLPGRARRIPVLKMRVPM